MPSEIVLTLSIVLIVILAAAIAFAVGHTMSKRTSAEHARLAQADTERILEEARTRQKELVLEAKEEAVKLKSAAEQDARERRAEVQRREQRLTQREEQFERKSEGLEKRDRQLTQQEHELESVRAEAERLEQAQRKELERIAGLTADEARAEVVSSIEAEAEREATARVREIEVQTKEEAARRARWIVSQAIQRCAAETTVETTQSSVTIPNEEMKGRIIGKEGRNIRALEQATGVDLIIDDTPEAVVLSSFDPVRREVARLSLMKLIADGRIHPTRIEEIVTRSKAEVEQQLREEGEKAAYEAGVHGLHPELVRTMGRLKFRYSYGQNQLAHSLEVAFLAATMAAELGADVNVCRRGGFLHDIGKAVDHEVDGPHAFIGADLAKKFNVPARIVHTIQAHHFEVEPQTVEAFLVAAADAISAARPGARRESVDNYIKRLEALEDVALGFRGVEKAYALQAGREVRVMVKPEQVDEDEAWRLNRDIVKRIEDTLDYPGQIKVTVIRETRVVDYAK
ncbi:MAG TPA: ribonuclease Y [Chloroflexota bacterium]|nr:ribonuclease Y [Chloroflexota bacterium]